MTEWEGLSGPLQEWMRANSTRPLSDVIIHEQDLRGALGVPGGQDSRRVRRSATGSCPASAPASPTCRRSRWSATGSRGPPRATRTPPTVVVRASDFDLARALVTRRSAAQLRSWTVCGDVGPYLDGFALLGALPATDLTE